MLGSCSRADGTIARSLKQVLLSVLRPNWPADPCMDRGTDNIMLVQDERAVAHCHSVLHDRPG